MYRYDLSVMPSEAGCAGEIKLRALLNRLQDVAGLAVKDREGSPGALMKRGYAWVLLRYALEVVRRLPGIDEDISIETRHTLNDGFYTLRVFRVFNSSNEAETLVLAKTSWVLIDLAAGRPVRAAQRLPEVFSGVANDPPIDPDFPSIPKLSGSKLRNAPPAPVSESVFPVRFHDLDTNGHVNNAVYFEWIFEATPLDPLAWGVREIHAEFRASAKLGDTVLVRAREEKKEKEKKEEIGETGVAPSGRAFVYEITDAAESAESGNAETGNEKRVRSLARFRAVWFPFGAQPVPVSAPAKPSV